MADTNQIITLHYTTLHYTIELNLCDFLTAQQSLVDAYKDFTFPQNASIRFDRRFKGLASKDDLIRYLKDAAKADMQELVISMAAPIDSKTNGYVHVTDVKVVSTIWF